MNDDKPPRTFRFDPDDPDAGIWEEMDAGRPSGDVVTKDAEGNRIHDFPQAGLLDRLEADRIRREHDDRARQTA